MRMTFLGVLLLALISCGDRDARQGPVFSVIIDVDGSAHSQTPENVRLVHQHRIEENLAKDPKAGKASVAIEPLPWFEPCDEDPGVWHYANPTVTVSPAAGSAADEAVIQALVSAFMKRHRDPAQPRLIVVVKRGGEAKTGG